MDWRSDTDWRASAETAAGSRRDARLTADDIFGAPPSARSPSPFMLVASLAQESRDAVAQEDADVFIASTRCSRLARGASVPRNRTVLNWSRRWTSKLFLPSK